MPEDRGQVARLPAGTSPGRRRSIRVAVRRSRTVAEERIHVHLLKLVSEVGEGYVIDPVEDLRPVCPNCHAVIRLRSDLPYSIEDEQAFFRPESRSTTDRAGRAP